MPYILDWVAYSGIVVKSWSRELPRELALQDLFGEGESKTSTTKGVDLPLSYNLASLIRLWINSSRILGSGDSPAQGSLSDCINVWVFWMTAIWSCSCSLSYLNASCSRLAFSWSRVTTSNHDLTALVALLSTLSYRQASEEADLLIMAEELGHWRLPLEPRRNRYIGSMWLIDG